jgi:hypothetical protein
LKISKLFLSALTCANQGNGVEIRKKGTGMNGKGIRKTFWCVLVIPRPSFPCLSFLIFKTIPLPPRRRSLQTIAWQKPLVT